ncbi:retinol dehydrogenase 8-like [Lytechinus variegatus]|uniref:retinol dehydrogenase 8-like n=1 Tax=Lytechinus variegatus TaxID=7654 RepID=UPI001BB2828B|nr:retinol dehydrogenase 8-like [Lytechinus variegatus]
MAQKVTLITGCSTGIGLTIAAKLGKDAAKKYLVYSTMRNLGKKDELEAASGDALNDTMIIRPLDVVSDDSVKKCVDEIIKEHGRIDVVINNAGVASFNPIEYAPMSDVRDVMETNFFGVVRMMQNVLPYMKEQRSGHIINVSSIAGVLAHPFYETYCASKHAMEALTEAVAFRMKEFDVRLTSVVPGPIATNINANIVEGNRLPPRQKIDPITREQLQYLAAHQKHHFSNEVQPVEEVAEIVQKIIEMDLSNGPVRFQTSDYVRERADMKYSDFGAVTWMKHIRKVISEPVDSESKPKQDESMV